MNQENSDRWLLFACAALGRQGEQSVQHAARLADEMALEYDRRYGDIAMLIAGIHNCYVCDKPITGPHIISDGRDGEYKKFCKACIDEHNPNMISEDNPGIVTETKQV